MKRLLLHKKDAFDARDHIMPLPTTTQLSEMLGRQMITLESDLGPVRDQGQSGSCTGNAGDGYMDWLFKWMWMYFEGKPSTVKEDYFSALFLYAHERLMNGTFPNDVGSDSRTAMRVLNQIGTCWNSQMPFADNLMAEAPTAEQTAQAAPYRIGAYHRVLWDPHLFSFKSCIASGYCRIIGIPAYKGIESDECAETGVLPNPKSTDTPNGGHELLVYGFNNAFTNQWQKSPIAVDLVRNSWGKDWGMGGNLVIRQDYYEIVGGNNTLDSWIGHMGKPWKPKTTA